MYDKIEEAFTPLFASYDINICDRKVMKYMSMINKEERDHIYLVTLGQQSIARTRPEYAIFKINILNKKFSHHLNLHDDSGDDNDFTIQYDEYHLLLNIVTPDSFLHFVSKVNKRFVFVPLNLSIEGQTSGHQTGIIVDKKIMKIYLYDPNGHTTFFNNIFCHTAKKNNCTNVDDLQIDGHDMVDRLMKSYVDELNKFDAGFEFVSSNIWNPNNKVINKYVNNSIFGNGHCVITTFLFQHYLQLIDTNMMSAFNEVSSLSQDEIFNLINNYSYCVFQILQPYYNKRLQNKKFVEALNKLKDEDD